MAATRGHGFQVLRPVRTWRSVQVPWRHDVEPDLMAQLEAGPAVVLGALAVFRNRPLDRERPALATCAVNLALWSAFQVLDEVFLAYEPGGVHRTLFTNQLLTLLAPWLLPAEQQP